MLSIRVVFWQFEVAMSWVNHIVFRPWKILWGVRTSPKAFLTLANSKIISYIADHEFTLFFFFSLRARPLP